MQRIRGTISERFDRQVDRSAGPDACWPWTTAADRYGYGKFYIDRATRIAHRVAWELANGPIPDGLHVLHRCDNRPCCNPAHLWLGTNADNQADMRAKGRARRGPPAGTQTHCKNGHPLSGDAVRIERSGWRRCVPCRRQYGRDYYRRTRDLTTTGATP